MKKILILITALTYFSNAYAEESKLEIIEPENSKILKDFLISQTNSHVIKKWGILNTGWLSCEYISFYDPKKTYKSSYIYKDLLQIKDIKSATFYKTYKINKQNEIYQPSKQTLYISMKDKKTYSCYTKNPKKLLKDIASY